MRDLFDLPLRVRRTYMAVARRLDAAAARKHHASTPSTIGVMDTVLDADIAFTTGQGLVSTRMDLLDLGTDLLILDRNGEGIRAVAMVADCRR